MAPQIFAFIVSYPSSFLVRKESAIASQTLCFFASMLRRVAGFYRYY